MATKKKLKPSKKNSNKKSRVVSQKEKKTNEKRAKNLKIDQRKYK